MTKAANDMTAFVLDASSALACILPDEQDPASEELLERWGRAGVHVPGLWHTEVLNTLLIAERRGRISRHDRLITLQDFKRLPTTVDGRVGAYAWDDVLPYAERFRLTVYDAAYLELAMRLSLPLATRDNQLADAGRRAGLTIFAA